MTEQNDNPVGISARRIADRSALGVAAVSAVFGLVVASLLLVNHLRSESADPLHTASLDRLRHRLSQSPGDETLRQDIRALDLIARRAYFSSQRFARTGAFLLLAATLVFLASWKLRDSLRPFRPRPHGTAPSGMPSGAAFASVAAIATLTSGLFLALAFWPGPAPPEPSSHGSSGRGGAPVPQPEPASSSIFQPLSQLPPAPSAEALSKNWPGLRGNGGAAHAGPGPWPVAWDGPSGKNVRWKVDVPLPGFSSAVVWEGRVFLTGADKKDRMVYGFDADDGALSWSWRVQGIDGSPEKPPKTTDDTGLAAPTPATDGRLVFAIFATGDVAALTLDGKPVWGRNLGVPGNPYGHGSSLVVFEDLLLVQYDTEEGGRFLGLDVATGKTAWEEERDVLVSWSTPLLADTGSGVETVLNANPFVIAYDPATGREKWRVEGMSGEVAPSPTFGSGLVFAANENAALLAMKPGTGEVVWETYDELPDVSSPLATGDIVLVPSGGGYLSCYDAKTGALLWDHDVGEGIYSSPVRAGDNIYLSDRKGRTLVFGASRTFQSKALNPLGEAVVSTPAFVNGRIYIRGTRHLFALETDHD